MATLRQYFETDFDNTIRVHGTLSYNDESLQCLLLYDVSAYTMFMSCYIEGTNRNYEYFLDFIKVLEYGRTEVSFTGNITLPSAKRFLGQLQIIKENVFEIKYRLLGDPTWQRARDITASRRLFIYSETDLDATATKRLQSDADSLGHKLQFRCAEYVRGRTEIEKPLAFICHDSRDKEEVARRIAVNLKRMLCTVWYDEFSLKVGESLRESIEKGMKECKKCILVLSPYFLSNSGWTKTEFNSIFTREILEETKLVLPVWHGVTTQEVFGYSARLLDVKGLDWKELGEDEVCRQLYRAIDS